MTILFFLLLAIFLCFSWSAWIEPSRFQINRYRVQIPRHLPKKIRILHLSDIHFRSPNTALFRFLNSLSRHAYDFVFVTGDIIDTNEGIRYAGEYLGKFKPFFGTYAVLGNHDYYNHRLMDVIRGTFMFGVKPKGRLKTDDLVSELRSKGICVLINESAQVSVDGKLLWVHGLDDPTTGQADIQGLQKHLSADLPNFLLTHSIDALLHLDSKDIDLSLSGHSHGGQIRFPWIGAVITHTLMGREYASGVKKVKETVCSISRGLSAGRVFWFRFLCPPEAIVLEVEGRPHLKRSAIEKMSTQDEF